MGRTLVARQARAVAWMKSLPLSRLTAETATVMARRNLSRNVFINRSKKRGGLVW
jgi:hypothetical protein